MHFAWRIEQGVMRHQMCHKMVHKVGNYLGVFDRLLRSMLPTATFLLVVIVASVVFVLFVLRFGVLSSDKGDARLCLLRQSLWRVAFSLPLPSKKGSSFVQHVLVSLVLVVCSFSRLPLRSAAFVCFASSTNDTAASQCRPHIAALPVRLRRANAA